MMHLVIYDPSDGRILKSIGLSDVRNLKSNYDENSEEAIQVNGPIDKTENFVDLSDPQAIALSPRPKVANPFPATGAVGLSVDISDLPLGTTITAENEAEEKVAVDPNSDVDFLDAGSYKLTIDPPFPYVGEEIEVVIT